MDRDAARENRTVDLEEALRQWAVTASLAEGLRTTCNAGGPWAVQAQKLLEQSYWDELRPELQKLVERFQERLKRDAYG